jgi:hypothetical protein
MENRVVGSQVAEFAFDEELTVVSLRSGDDPVGSTHDRSRIENEIASMMQGGDLD